MNAKICEDIDLLLLNIMMVNSFQQSTADHRPLFRKKALVGLFRVLLPDGLNGSKRNLAQR